MDGSPRKDHLLYHQLPGKEHHVGAAGAERLHPAQKKGAVPCLLFQPALVCTGVGSHMLQPRRDLDQMETLLHPSSGTETGFGRAGGKGGGPAGDLGQDPGLMSYPGPAELPAHLELGKMRQAHLHPLGTGTWRALLLALCLQPS